MAGLDEMEQSTVAASPRQCQIPDEFHHFGHSASANLCLCKPLFYTSASPALLDAGKDKME